MKSVAPGLWASALFLWDELRFDFDDGGVGGRCPLGEGAGLPWSKVVNVGFDMIDQLFAVPIDGEFDLGEGEVLI